MEPINLSEYEEAARSRIDAGAFDYIAGAAGDEVTLACDGARSLGGHVYRENRGL